MNPFSEEDLTRLNAAEEEEFKKRFEAQYRAWTPLEHKKFLKVARLPNLCPEEGTRIQQIRHFASPNRSEAEVRLHYSLVQKGYPKMKTISPVVTAVLEKVGYREASHSKRSSSSAVDSSSDFMSSSSDFRSGSDFLLEAPSTPSPNPSKRKASQPSPVEDPDIEISPDAPLASLADGHSFATALLQENERLVSELDMNISAGILSANVGLMQQFRQNVLVLQNWLSCNIQLSKMPELPPLPVKLNMTFFPAHQTFLNLDEIESSLQNMKLRSSQNTEIADSLYVDPPLLNDEEIPADLANIFNFQ